jgi:putative ABC transport system ATP-binding protein
MNRVPGAVTTVFEDSAEILLENSPVLEVRDLERQFLVGEEELLVLKGVTFSIQRGEYVAVIGPSGSGKSTLMYQMGCLDTPSSGLVRIAGYDISELGDDELAALRNQTIGFVFQAFNLLARTTAIDNVALPLRYAGVPHRDRHDLARAALARVGLSHRERHTPDRLSGGEKQRVAIARAIVTSPQILLCDEPTGNLDQKSGAEIVRLFEQLNRELGVTIILVTHDLALARRVQRVIRIVDGYLVYDGPAGALPA